MQTFFYYFEILIKFRVELFLPKDISKLSTDSICHFLRETTHFHVKCERIGLKSIVDSLIYKHTDHYVRLLQWLNFLTATSRARRFIGFVTHLGLKETLGCMCSSLMLLYQHVVMVCGWSFE